jgi:hypothetical protein
MTIKYTKIVIEKINKITLQLILTGLCLQFCRSFFVETKLFDARNAHDGQPRVCDDSLGLFASEKLVL